MLLGRMLRLPLPLLRGTAQRRCQYRGSRRGRSAQAPPLRLLGGSSEAATGSKAVGSCTRGCAPYRCTSILRRINKANREEGTRRGGRECEGGDQPKDIMQFSSVLLKAYAPAADPFSGGADTGQHGQGYQTRPVTSKER